MSPGPAEGVFLKEIAAGKLRSFYLVAGESVLAEPAALRVAQAVAEAVGSEVQVLRRPVGLQTVLADLRTFALFGGGKVRMVLESAVLSDRGAAAYLIDQAVEALPVASGDGLSPKEREAAGRLLQVLHLFEVSATLTPETAVSELPDWVFEGGKAPGSKAKLRKRTKKQVAEIREQAVGLLAVAEVAGLQGFAEVDASDLAALLQDGLPEGHCLVMAESAVAKDHPVVARLSAEGSVIQVATVEADRKGQWAGTEALAAELAEETGTAIQPAALRELVRRTLRQQPNWGGSAATEATSTKRFAAEYRKLSALASAGTIDRDLVASVVQDRGQEDLWGVLDSISAGNAGEAVERLQRLIDGADDPMAARLGFFSQLAQFSRHLSAISGMMTIAGVPAGERNYNRFKSQWAPRLQKELPGTDVGLLKGLHPYRLHKAYLAVSRFSARDLRLLPEKVLDTEMSLKGESLHPDAALTDLVLRLSGPGRHA